MKSWHRASQASIDWAARRAASVSCTRTNQPIDDPDRVCIHTISSIATDDPARLKGFASSAYELMSTRTNELSGEGAAMTADDAASAARTVMVVKLFMVAM